MATNFLGELNLNPSLLELPVQIADPVYGTKNVMFRDYMTPGVVLSIVFLSSISLTAISLVTERKHGQFERCIVSGVPPPMILLASILSNVWIIALQICLVLYSTFSIFGVSLHGEGILIFLLCLVQGICGLSFGLMVASISKHEISALMFGLGFFYPSLLLSGTVWPIEAMHPILQYFSTFMPQTPSITSLRYMISRGWGLNRADVVQGFNSSFMHIFLYCLIACIVFKKFKN